MNFNGDDWSSLIIVQIFGELMNLKIFQKPHLKRREAMFNYEEVPGELLHHLCSKLTPTV